MCGNVVVVDGLEWMNQGEEAQVRWRAEKAGEGVSMFFYGILGTCKCQKKREIII